MNMRKKWKWIVIAPAALTGMLILVALVGAIGGEIVKYLWNWLMPPLFGWHTVTFWQALGLLALCRILFGSHVFRNHSRRRTSEERDKFRQGMRDRFGFHPSTPQPGANAAP